MNKELAIAILEDMVGDCKGNCLTKDKEALEYAIDVLKKEKEESIHTKEDAPEVPVPEQSLYDLTRYNGYLFLKSSAD